MNEIVYKPLQSSTNDSVVQLRQTIPFELFLLAQGTRIQRFAYQPQATAGSSNNVYTVPAGKIFFCISASLSGNTDPGDNNSREVHLLVGGTGTGTSTWSIMHIETGGQAGADNAETAKNVQASFSPPLRIDGGETIWVLGVNSGSFGSGGVIGYLVDAAEFYALIK